MPPFAVRLRLVQTVTRSSVARSTAESTLAHLEHSWAGGGRHLRPTIAATRRAIPVAAITSIAIPTAIAYPVVATSVRRVAWLVTAIVTTTRRLVTIAAFVATISGTVNVTPRSIVRAGWPAEW